MAKKKDPHAEKVTPGTQPKRGPKGSQSPAMDWLSARMEGHPSSSQARLKAALGPRAYARLSSRPSDVPPVVAARRRRRGRENASTDYSKLRFLGRFLAEKEIQLTLPIEGGPKAEKPAKGKQKRRTPTKKPKKHKDAPGQLKLPLGSRRKERAIPRRRKGERGRRAIDKPTSKRKRGFKPSEKGERASDAPVVTATAAVASTGRGKRYSKAFRHYYAYQLGRGAAKKVGRGFRALTKRRRKATGPNPLTGGTEGSRGVQT